MICDYGCGKEAKYEMTSGKWKEKEDD